MYIISQYFSQGMVAHLLISVISQARSWICMCVVYRYRDYSDEQTRPSVSLLGMNSLVGKKAAPEELVMP